MGEQTGHAIEVPGPDDARAIGPMHLAAWLETYPNAGLGIDKAWIREHLGFLDTEASVQFRRGVLDEQERSPDRVLYRVVRSGDEVTGFLHGHRDDDGTAHLDAIYLRDRLKGQGVADALLQVFLSWAGDVPMCLEVVEYNARAVRFYARHGFEETGKRGTWQERVPTAVMSRPGGAEPGKAASSGP